MSLDPEVVRAAALAWVWVPDDAREVRTSEFHLIAYPATFATPTVAARIDSERAPADLVDDVLAAAAGLGRTDVAFWTHPHTRPTGLVDHLLERGAVLEEQLAVLARPLADLPDLAVPADVEVRRVTDLATRTDLDRVDTTVFGGQALDDEALAASVEAVAAELRWVAYRDGDAVGAAGMTLGDDHVRLWGAGVLAEARGTGVYRALLDHRLREARASGVAMALVKGRVDTSAPVLQRAGFAAYGEERSYRLVVR